MWYTPVSGIWQTVWLESVCRNAITDIQITTDLAKATMSIGACKAIEFGDGINVSTATGSTNNDEFDSSGSGIYKKSNHSGGLLGGMSDGSDIIIRNYFKPTPSISKEQQTVTKDGTPTTISIHGRHDPVIVPRAVVVVESMCAVTILDALLVNMSSRLDKIRDFYR